MLLKLVSGIDIQMVDALKNLGIQEVNKYTLEKILHQETFVERSDFIKNFSEKEWEILVEGGIITQGGKILIPCRSAFELGKLVHGKLNERVTAMQSYLQKIFSKHGKPITQLPEYSFSLTEQPYMKNVVEILLRETGVYLEREIFYFIKNQNTFSSISGTKKIEIKNVGWGKYDIFVNDQKAEHFETRKEALALRLDTRGGYFSKEEKDKIIDIFEKEGVFLSMQVRDYLYNIKRDQLLGGNSASFVEKTVAEIAGILKNGKVWDSKVKDFCEYLTIQLSAPGDFNKYYNETKLLISRYELIVNSDSARKTQDILLVKDLDFFLHETLSLRKQILAIVCAHAVKDKKTVEGLLRGLAVFISEDKKFLLDQFFSFNQRNEQAYLKENPYFPGDLLKAVALFWSLAMSEHNSSYAGNYFQLAERVLQDIPEWEQIKNSYYNGQIINLGDYPLPYLGMLNNYRNNSTQRNYAKIEEIYKNVKELYEYSYRIHEQYKEISKNEPLYFYERRMNFFSHLQVAGNYHISEKDFSKKELQILYKKLLKFDQKNLQAAERVKDNILKVFNEFILTSNLSLFGFLEKEYERLQEGNLREKEKAKKYKNFINKIINEVVLGKTGPFYRLTQAERFKRRKFNRRIIEFLLHDDSDYQPVRKALVTLDLEENMNGERYKKVDRIRQRLFEIGVISSSTSVAVHNWILNNGSLIDEDYDLRVFKTLLDFYKNDLAVYPYDKESLVTTLSNAYQQMFEVHSYTNYNLLVPQYYLALDYLFQTSNFRKYLRDLPPEVINKLIQEKYLVESYSENKLVSNLSLSPRVFDTNDGAIPFFTKRIDRKMILEVLGNKQELIDILFFQTQDDFFEPSLYFQQLLNAFPVKREQIETVFHDNAVPLADLLKSCPFVRPVISKFFVVPEDKEWQSYLKPVEKFFALLNTEASFDENQKKSLETFVNGYFVHKKDWHRFFENPFAKELVFVNNVAGLFANVVGDPPEFKKLKKIWQEAKAKAGSLGPELKQKLLALWTNTLNYGEIRYAIGNRQRNELLSQLTLVGTFSFLAEKYDTDLMFGDMKDIIEKTSEQDLFLRFEKLANYLKNNYGRNFAGMDSTGWGEMLNATVYRKKMVELKKKLETSKTDEEWTEYIEKFCRVFLMALLNEYIMPSEKFINRLCELYPEIEIEKLKFFKNYIENGRSIYMFFDFYNGITREFSTSTDDILKNLKIVFRGKMLATDIKNGFAEEDSSWDNMVELITDKDEIIFKRNVQKALSQATVPGEQKEYMFSLWRGSLPWEHNDYGYRLPFLATSLLATEQNNDLQRQIVFNEYLNVLHNTDINPTNHGTKIAKDRSAVFEMNYVYDLQAFELMPIFIYFNKDLLPFDNII